MKTFKTNIIRTKKRKHKSKKKNKNANVKRTIKKRKILGGNIKEEPDTFTPRKRYKKDFLNYDVFLIPSKSYSGFSLFQVNFYNEEQFKNYLNLSETPTQNDCFFQSVYSLGLRDLKLAKLNSENVELHSIEGVDTEDVEKYIKESFGLTGSVQTWFKSDTILNWTQEMVIENLELWLNDLQDNCATLLFLELSYGGHFVVAYKHNNIIYYFDPQGTRQKDNTILISSKIIDIISYELKSFGCFYVEGLTEKMPLIKNDCHIEFYG